MLLVILTLLIIIIVLLLYLVFSSQEKYPDKTLYSTKIEKANDFVLDMCTQIGEENNYIVLYGNRDNISGNKIYIEFNDTCIQDVYSRIIELLADDISKKNNNKDIDTTKRRIEQVAYNLRYLSSEFNGCS